tara:strand:+ start:3408 stop:3887 length:480 start_codon:yes stop_codon:yes gene_type:complete
MQLFKLITLCTILITLSTSAKTKNLVQKHIDNPLKHGLTPCEAGTHNCVAPEVCQDLEGSHTGFTCECPPGFVSTPALNDSSPEAAIDAVCSDIDECIQMTDTCADTTTCRNLEGSFECIDSTEESQTSWSTLVVSLLGGIFALILLLFVILFIWGIIF